MADTPLQLRAQCPQHPLSLGCSSGPLRWQSGTARIILPTAHRASAVRHAPTVRIILIIDLLKPPRSGQLFGLASSRQIDLHWARKSCPQPFRSSGFTQWVRLGRS